VVFSVAAVIATVSSMLVLPASAQTSTAAQGIEISPALVELNAGKGNSYTIKLKVTNVASAALEYTTTIEDFAAKDETGSPQVLIDSTLPPNASVKTWVSIVPKFTLQSRESRDIIADVTVPDNAEPGGHYGVIRFAGRAPDVKDTGVGLAASAGVLMLIRVDGAITEQASIASLYSANADGKQQSIFESGPINFVTRIQNDGNIHVKPVGSLVVHDMFGGLVTTMAINDTKSNVLPHSIRRFNSEYKSGWMFGMYTAELSLGYGTTGQAITGTTTFWVIPYKLLLVILAVIITLVFIFKRMLKAYNKRIIAKARHEYEKQNKKPTNKKG
jgi:hypothetical protein